MKMVTVLRALPALLTLSGCVAILDVDSEEYLDEAVCSCFAEGRSICEGYIEAFSKVRGFERLVTSCIQSESTCRQLGDCMREGGICNQPGDACDPFDDGKKTLQFRCCEGDCTEQGTCPVACQDLAQACGGADGDCCAGLECGDDSLCCRGLGAECDPQDSSSPCCGAGDRVRCIEGECASCSPDNETCNDQLPCCNQGPDITCRLQPGGGLEKFCLSPLLD
jgi:hypothetical protein